MFADADKFSRSGIWRFLRFSRNTSVVRKSFNNCQKSLSIIKENLSIIKESFKLQQALEISRSSLVINNPLSGTIHLVNLQSISSTPAQLDRNSDTLKVARFFHLIWSLSQGHNFVLPSYKLLMKSHLKPGTKEGWKWPLKISMVRTTGHVLRTVSTSKKKRLWSLLFDSSSPVHLFLEQSTRFDNRMADPHEVSQKYLNENKGNAVIQVCIAFIVILTLFVPLRFYSRWSQGTKWSWDDAVVVPAYLFCISLCCFTLGQ